MALSIGRAMDARQGPELRIVDNRLLQLQLLRQIVIVIITIILTITIIVIIVLIIIIITIILMILSQCRFLMGYPWVSVARRAASACVSNA